jgi:hypothetical protein
MYLIDKYLGEAKGKNDLMDRIKKAKKLGTVAFKKGKKAIPVQDRDLMNLLKGLPVGGGGDKIIDAWSASWHKANLGK